MKAMTSSLLWIMVMTITSILQSLQKKQSRSLLQSSSMITILKVKNGSMAAVIKAGQLQENTSAEIDNMVFVSPAILFLLHAPLQQHLATPISPNTARISITQTHTPISVKERTLNSLALSTTELATPCSMQI